MGIWAARIGAVFYVLWGVFHLVAADAVYALAEQSTELKAQLEVDSEASRARRKTYLQNFGPIRP
jgi:hypothetical protein